MQGIRGFKLWGAARINCGLALAAAYAPLLCEVGEAAYRRGFYRTTPEHIARCTAQLCCGFTDRVQLAQPCCSCTVRWQQCLLRLSCAMADATVQKGQQMFAP